MSDRLDEFMEGLEARSPGERVFHQAVREMFVDVFDELDTGGALDEQGILERMTEPDRSVIFRVAWQDDEGVVHTNRAFRVQFNNAIGPYKGGLRFVEGSTWRRSSSSASRRPSRTRSPACRWAAPRAAPTSTPRATPSSR